MVAPLVLSLMLTVCAVVYVPAAGLKVGVAAAPRFDAIVQPMISWMAVTPPVPPVKPT
jgi:hypothetical protein